MKKNKNILLLLLIAVAFATSSCSDFLDVNSNPNQLTDDNITPNLIFTQAENAIGNRQASRFVFLNNWMGYWGRSGTFIVEQEETTYKVGASSTEAEYTWDQTYDILFDLYLTKTKALAVKDSILAGASMVLSAKLWQETVDVYGNIPYSQAFSALKNPQPAYDNATDIYANLLVQLDSAIFWLNAKDLTLTSAKAFSKTDIIFARGDGTSLNASVIGQWKKLANTIKLRIFLRQSEKGFVPSAAQLAKITTDGGFLGAGEDVSVNPGYSNQQDKQNPFYADYGLTPTGSAATSNNTPNNYFLKKIINGDPRASSFYSSPATGTDYGALGGDHTLSSTVTGSVLGPNGLAPYPTSDQFILPAFESLFFQAEATIRGWLPGSDAAAKVLYENAIQQSFRWLQVSSKPTLLSGNALADSIFKKYIVKKVINWDSTGPALEQKLKLMTYQKYVAMCGEDPLEAWSDLRRLNDRLDYLPDGYLSWNPQRADHLPYVLPYPQTEVTANAAHVPSRSTTTIFTEKLFWQP